METENRYKELSNTEQSRVNASEAHQQMPTSVNYFQTPQIRTYSHASLSQKTEKPVSNTTFQIKQGQVSEIKENHFENLFNGLSAATRIPVGATAKYSRASVVMTATKSAFVELEKDPFRCGIAP